MTLLTGCEKNITELTLGDVLESLFSVRIGKSDDGDDTKKPLTEHLYSDYDRNKAIEDTKQMEERFSYEIAPYQRVANQLWQKEGFYKNQEKNISPRDTLIDFYLFMEYHKDTQRRNLQFPEVLQKDLLLIEALFMKKAIDYVSGQNLGKYNILRDDMVTLYRNMYREELLNILYEGHEQIELYDRIPNIISRYNSEIKNIGLSYRLKKELGIPDTLIARGMGSHLITLYNQSGDLAEGDVKKFAIILAMEMRLTGISMRLERFFHVANSLEGLGQELTELRKDVELIRPTGDLDWVQQRMLRSIDYLQNVYLYYIGKKKYTSVEQVFMNLQTREDFYALGMLSDQIKKVMDKEDYWEEVDRIKKLMLEDRYKNMSE